MKLSLLDVILESNYAVVHFGDEFAIMQGRLEWGSFPNRFASFNSFFQPLTGLLTTNKVVTRISQNYLEKIPAPQFRITTHSLTLQLSWVWRVWHSHHHYQHYSIYLPWDRASLNQTFRLIPMAS